jgi:peptidoglycan/xylan/chitin deacetylase (PgdA/CDA1 family)
MKSANRTRRLRRFTAGLFKEALGRILVACRAHHWLLRGKVIVVVFHSVTRQRSDGTLRCSLEDFERYCAFFARHFRVETFTRVVERLQRHEPLNGELSVTFDDGYADNAELALGVLGRWHLPATFFISTGFVESDTQSPWDQKANVRSRWMSWPQVAQLTAAGHEIGSHTVSHANLAELQGADIASELRRSRDDLSTRAGIVAKHLAVPYGRRFPSLEQTVAIAREQGFASVSLCRGGLADHANSGQWIERWPIDATAYLSPFGWIVDVIRDALARVSPGSIPPPTSCARLVTERTLR